MLARIGLARIGLARIGLSESGLPQMLARIGLARIGLSESGLPQAGLPQAGLPEAGPVWSEWVRSERARPRLTMCGDARLLTVTRLLHSGLRQSGLQRHSRPQCWLVLT